jgi:hypothetical protein
MGSLYGVRSHHDSKLNAVVPGDESAGAPQPDSVAITASGREGLPSMADSDPKAAQRIEKSGRVAVKYLGQVEEQALLHHAHRRLNTHINRLIQAYSC